MVELIMQRPLRFYLILGAMLALCAAMSLLIPRLAAAQADGRVAFTNATVIDGTGAPPVEDATVTLEDGRIACVGECEAPANAEVIDAEGQYVIPGLADAHVHYWLSGWLDTFPGFDVSDRFPPEEAFDDLQENPERFHRSYLCSGVNAVLDPGGPPWTLELQQEAEKRADAPHYLSAGPLLTAMHQMPDHRHLGDAFIYMEDEEAVREGVRMLAEQGAEVVKVHRPDLFEDAERRQPLLDAAGEEVRRTGFPLIANTPTLASAKEALRAGPDLLIYPVEDTLVDEEFLELKRQNDAVYLPALTVNEAGAEVRERAFQEEHLPLGCVDPETREKARLTNSLPAAESEGSEALPERDETVQSRREENLRRVHEAGITVAVGASGGAPLMHHGPATAYEMQALAEVGLSPMDVLVAATSNGAKAMARDDFGTLELGKAADLVVLERNPLEDIANVRSVVQVVRSGKVWTREELEYR